MSLKVTSNLNMQYKQIENVIVHLRPDATGLSNALGVLYTNTTDKGFYYNNGTTFVRLDNQSMTASQILTALLTVDGANSALDADVLDGQHGSWYLSRANHSGSQLASTISDFNTAVRTNRLNELANPNASVSLNSQRITNLANPSAANDAANKSYVDNAVQGLDAKASVLAASTADIPGTDFEGVTLTPTTPFSSIDGVTITNGARILLKNQSNASQNGIYTVSGFSGGNVTELTRADDFNSESKVVNAYVFVERGTVNSDTGWVVTTNSVTTIGTDPINWVQFSAAGVIEAGAGLTKTGQTIAIDTSVVARKYSASVGDGAATTFTLTHSLNTEDVVVTVREAGGSKEVVLTDVAITGLNTISVSFAEVPSNNQYRVTVIG